MYCSGHLLGGIVCTSYCSWENSKGGSSGKLVEGIAVGSQQVDIVMGS